MAYEALVCRINHRDVGLKTLALGTVGNYQVLVGKDTPQNALGVFFEAGTQLSEEYASVNDLVRRRDASGNVVGGLLDVNRHVRSIKLGGVISEGLWMPIESLGYINLAANSILLSEGMEFTSLNDHHICQKYISKATREKGVNVPGVKTGNQTRSELLMLPRHPDTTQFRRASHLIPDESIVYITEKAHGYSIRFGNVLVEKEEQVQWSWPEDLKTKGLPWYRRLALKLSHAIGYVSGLLLNASQATITYEDFEHTNASRNVVFQNMNGVNGWNEAVKGLRLLKGEVIFGEVVGFEPSGKAIQNGFSTGKDKGLQKIFGNTAGFSYGCEPGKCELLVYRIAMYNEDGKGYDLSFPQMQKRVRELGLETVKLLKTFIYKSGVWTPADLQRIVDHYANQLQSPTDPNTLNEGVVVRYESEHGIGFLKDKSKTFSLLHNGLKNEETYVDNEENEAA